MSKSRTNAGRRSPDRSGTTPFGSTRPFELSKMGLTLAAPRALRGQEQETQAQARIRETMKQQVLAILE